MVVKMEQKELNNLSAEELDAMADALLAADDAKQAETADKPAADKPDAEKTTEEKLNDLVEKGIPVDLSATTVAEARDSILKAFK